MQDGKINKLLNYDRYLLYHYFLKTLFFTRKQPGFRYHNEGRIKLDHFGKKFDPITETFTDEPTFHLSNLGAELLAEKIFKVCMAIPNVKFD